MSSPTARRGQMTRAARALRRLGLGGGGGGGAPLPARSAVGGRRSGARSARGGRRPPQARRRRGGRPGGGGGGEGGGAGRTSSAFGALWDIMCIPRLWEKFKSGSPLPLIESSPRIRLRETRTHDGGRNRYESMHNMHTVCY